MPIRIAINGFGRIGKNIVRALYERSLNQELEVVAINDLGQPEVLAHLLQFDTVHGRFAKDVSSSESAIQVGNDTIQVYSERDPTQLPWGQLGIDVVLECTGLFTQREEAEKHLTAGARKVIISAPGKGVDATVVYGVNHHTLTSDMRVISNASCTTNCLAPIAKPLHEALGIESGLMTTVHAYTNDQRLTDSYHSDLQRARAAAQSMIPSKTGAAAAVGLVIPELQGRFDGLAVRVPTPNVSLVDLNFIAERDTSVNEINQIIQDAASLPHFQGVLTVNELPLVSSDYNHNSHSSIFDARQTRVNGRLVKVMAWYDNEWGFSNRMLDNTVALMNASGKEVVTKNEQDIAESY
ncbi:glyceraldehyde-3-phosphate dehydrogenase (NAD+) [Idiomarina loihiensis]|uniref:type I glyceraldehyde-3-phosphate dehydrogenase n=1 Tax=Idiomarina TaxID=135575 RepID=UPI000D71B08C|nr:MULTISPECIES: type I glyceraldehyde-3-phosphate dehydrogenase [Idiomarina]PWW36954.1 glyceraldehyde-3-phosphate dehydrogenase (NAD+) [Idiomarina loihiensis]TDP46762.1 glyceraldehyde-3-phosphate dehydrogenase (NAD+) [Idiomarina loihiensis]TDS23033.1 glyceraldehyde-3-phosphate dehydrogenase (NAD+) [Idiomarina sp. H2]